MDWCGPPGPSIPYLAPVSSSPAVSTARDPLFGFQRFYQDFRFPSHSDTFPDKLFDVASSTIFVAGDTQAQLRYAINRLFALFFWYYLYIL